VANEASGPFGLTANGFWPYGQPEKNKNTENTLHVTNELRFSAFGFRLLAGSPAICQANQLAAQINKLVRENMWHGCSSACGLCYGEMAKNNSISMTTRRMLDMHFAITSWAPK